MTDNVSKLDKEFFSMFGIDESVETDREFKYLDVRKISFHPDDPFRLLNGEELNGLSESIEKIGVIEPITVRPYPNGKPGEYQVLSGRRRLLGCRKNKLLRIPAVIRDVNDEQAIIILTDANLQSRDEILPSERAKAYRMQLEAIKKQGKRTDLDTGETSAQPEHKTSREIVAERYKVDKNVIQRHIRLTYLIRQLLNLIDEGELNMGAGIEISNLDEKAQTILFDYYFIKNTKEKLDNKTAEKIKKYYAEHGEISVEALNKLKTKTVAKKTFNIDRHIFYKYKGLPEKDSELMKLFEEFLSSRYEKVV